MAQAMPSAVCEYGLSLSDRGAVGRAMPSAPLAALKELWLLGMADWCPSVSRTLSTAQVINTYSMWVGEEED